MSNPVCFGCMYQMKSLLACYGDFCPHIKECTKKSNEVLDEKFPSYVKTQITYNEESGTFTAWDETCSIALGEYDSWIEAAYRIIDHIEKEKNG